MKGAMYWSSSAAMSACVSTSAQLNHVLCHHLCFAGGGDRHPLLHGEGWCKDPGAGEEDERKWILRVLESSEEVKRHETCVRWRVQQKSRRGMKRWMLSKSNPTVKKI
jgi:hypothetical protein